MTTIDLKAHELLDKLRITPIPACHEEMELFYEQCINHLENIEKSDQYLLGCLSAIICYERLYCRDAPRLAYICLTADTRQHKNENRSITERLQLVMMGGIGLIEEKTSCFSMDTEKVIDFAIMADVLRLHKVGFNSTENWWRNALDGQNTARRKYPSYTDEQIISIGQKIHETVAESVYKYLLNIYS